AGARIIEAVVQTVIRRAEAAIIAGIGAVAAIRTVAVTVVAVASVTAVTEPKADVAVGAAAESDGRRADQNLRWNTHGTPAVNTRVVPIERTAKTAVPL